MPGVYDAFGEILTRIRDQVPAFALVDSPSVVMSEDDVLTKLPGCYVFPGPSEPTDQGNKNALKGEDQDWIVLITVAYPAADSAAPEIELGERVLGVIQALNNWSPANNAYRIRYRNRSAVEYEEGYASIKLRFTHRKVII